MSIGIVSTGLLVPTRAHPINGSSASTIALESPWARWQGTEGAGVLEI